MKFDYFLKYVRKNIGSYCTDSYWRIKYNLMIQSDHPILWLKNNLSYLAINAIGTSSSSRF